jgi:prephenate dehydrogenase
MFNKLCIIGVGLIGGSIAKAARQNQLAKTIVGFGRIEDESNLKTAQILGVIDDYYLDIAEAVNEADCVLIATPVGCIKSIFQQLKPYWSTQTLYTDVGSTKVSVIEAAQAVFGLVPSNLIPAHPIAGAEQSGVQAAIVDLFYHKRLIITPVDTTDAEAVDKITLFWQKLGAEVSIMDAEHHDTVLSATSHLPHLLAFALVNMLGHQDEQSEIFKYAAGGFRDFTRIASSNPTMWLDICMANKIAIIPLIQQLRDELRAVEHNLIEEQSQALLHTFEYAHQARQRFLQQFKS